MNSLHLLLALPARPDQLLDHARQVAPSLIKLLRRGAPTPPASGITEAISQACGIERQQDWPLASLCAAADGLPVSAEDYWLRLDPVHLEVVMGGLILRPSASLRLSQQEADALITAINQHWQPDDLHIQAVSPTRWYLRLPQAPNLRTTPLDQMGGEYLTPNLPRGADARLFLQRINEIQMLMHSHPLNLARDNEGRPPVNGLWLWGGGILPAATAKFDLIAADDFAARAMALHVGTPSCPQPRSWAELKPGNRALVVLTQPEAEASGDLVARLAQLERDWFQPLLHQLFLGRIRQLRLDLIGHQAALLTPARAWRFWR
jgi:hypothetical protein